MRKKSKEKKGISLIVLVITIIVMIILAATIIISLNNNGIIGNASDAVIASDIAHLKTQTEIIKADTILEALKNHNNLTQQQLVEAIRANFKDSTVSGNTVTVEKGKYDIVVEGNLNITIVKSGEYTGPIKDINVTYTTTLVGSKEYANVEVELLNAPEMRKIDINDVSTMTALTNEFLNWLDWEGLLVHAGKMLQPGANLDAATVYAANVQSILGVDFETFKANENRDALVKEKTGYDTAEILFKNMIVAQLDLEMLLAIGENVLYAQDMLPELKTKTADEMELIITSWYNNTKTIDEITKEVVQSPDIEVSTFEQWHALLSVVFGITYEPAYIFSREQAMIIVAAEAYTATHPVVIEYPDGTTKEYDWYLRTSISDTSQLLTSASSGIRVTSPKQYEELVQSTVKNNWITAIVDGVPIPKGFVASAATGENTKNEGLVIYEGTTPVTDDNVFDAKRTRNQYVWVPVDDFSKYMRQNFGRGVTISDVIGTDYWEVKLINKLTIYDLSRMTKETLKEVQNMYDSVKTYGGFYIARYEAGLDVGSHKTVDDGEIIKTVHSKMNKAPYNWVRWTYNNAMNEDTNGAVEVARSIYPESNSNYGVVSTLTYGVQWDRTLAWWIETKAKNGTGDVTIESNTQINNSINYGNYSNNEIPLNTFNSGAKYLLYSSSLATTYADVTAKKTTSDRWLLTTGATEEARVNNIYDIAGNLWEWTMEGSSSSTRVYRGGSFLFSGDGCPVSYRNDLDPDNAIYFIGFRSSLYIKK